MGNLTENRVVDYLAEVIGEAPWLEAMSDQLVSKIPLYLRQRYEFFRACLLYTSRCV